MEETPRWSRYCPAGLRRFREAYGAAGPRRDLFRKAQLDKPHDLVTPSTIAAQLRRSHRSGHYNASVAADRFQFCFCYGCGAPLTPPIEKPSSCVHSAADLKAVFTGEPRQIGQLLFTAQFLWGVSTYEVPIQTPGENAARRLR